MKTFVLFLSFRRCAIAFWTKRHLLVRLVFSLLGPHPYQVPNKQSNYIELCGVFILVDMDLKEQSEFFKCKRNSDKLSFFLTPWRLALTKWSFCLLSLRGRWEEEEDEDEAKIRLRPSCCETLLLSSVPLPSHYNKYNEGTRAKQTSLDRKHSYRCTVNAT